MCTDCCFYFGLAGPIASNLAHRLSDEMVDLGVNVKRKMFKAISFSFAGRMESDEQLDIVHEIPGVEKEKSKPVTTEVVRQQQRPLPRPPVPSDLKTVESEPWFKNVDRKKGEELLKYGVDGHFLVRPSSLGDVSLTLTLWYRGRLYNLVMRKRTDGQYALGTPKTNEQNFTSVKEMIQHYQREKLVLYSNGVRTGRTLLTCFPP